MADDNKGAPWRGKPGRPAGRKATKGRPKRDRMTGYVLVRTIAKVHAVAGHMDETIGEVLDRAIDDRIKALSKEKQERVAETYKSLCEEWDLMV